MTVIQSGLASFGAAGRYSLGSRAKRAGASPDAARGGGASVFSVARWQHGGDLADGDDVEVQRAPARGVGRPAAVAFGQAQQPVHLPHPRPRQVMVEQRSA